MSLVDACKKAAKQFLFYAEQHDAKGTAESSVKAEVNRQMAAEMTDAVEHHDNQRQAAYAVQEAQRAFNDAIMKATMLGINVHVEVIELQSVVHNHPVCITKLTKDV